MVGMDKFIPYATNCILNENFNIWMIKLQKQWKTCLKQIKGREEVKGSSHHKFEEEYIVSIMS